MTQCAPVQQQCDNAKKKRRLYLQDSSAISSSEGLSILLQTPPLHFHAELERILCNSFSLIG
jgi:hypothetical protein